MAVATIVSVLGARSFLVQYDTGAAERAAALDALNARHVQLTLDIATATLAAAAAEDAEAPAAADYRAATDAYAAALLAEADAQVIDAALTALEAAKRTWMALQSTTRLARTELTAPFDGVVISGDWSRSLGVPVTRGDLMFEIAPLDAYRVALQVNDRDIAALAPGQQGSLTLTALPRQPVRFELTDVSSLADEQVSEPMFRVEADLWDNPPALRPGMQGIAKVHAGQRQRWWIWTHALTDWLQLQWWHWRP